jgi:hypothetical protein
MYIPSYVREEVGYTSSDLPGEREHSLEYVRLVAVGMSIDTESGGASTFGALRSENKRQPGAAVIIKIKNQGVFLTHQAHAQSLLGRQPNLTPPSC